MGLAAFNRMRRLQAEQAGQAGNTEVDPLEELRARGKELGIPRASQMKEDKLREAIAEKEAEIEAVALLAEQEKQLQELRAKAVELGIEGAEEKDAETLAAEIATLEG